MKKQELLKKITLIMAMISIFLILVWVIFYLLTIGIIRRNLTQITEAGSNNLIERAEEELLSLQYTSESIGGSEQALAAVTAASTLDFYDKCAELSALTDTRFANNDPADNIVLFHANGSYYRLRGSISNTALKRTYYLMEGEAARTIAISSHGNHYIGSCYVIQKNGKKAGYIVAFMEQSGIERILDVYHDLDYLGVALLSADQILYSNRDLRVDDLDNVKTNAVFYKEKEIGLSGFRLLVYSERSLTKWLSAYFSIALPAMTLLFIAVMSFSIRYLKRSIADSIELEKERSLIALLKKQISAHFTVNTLNDVRSLIQKGEQESARQICSRLSVLLRYANATDEYITLLKEFWVLEQYVGIMQMRYPGRIHADIEADDEFENILIPRMLLQPIVENAIQHGLAGRTGTITVAADIGDDEVIITVTDDGAGMNEEQLKLLNEGLGAPHDPEKDDLTHIALKNIQHRIHIVCGDAYGLTICSCCAKTSSSPYVPSETDTTSETVPVKTQKRQGTVVTVRLPLIIAGS